MGLGALKANTTGAQNVGIGSLALLTNITSSGNTAIGFEALKLSNSNTNTAIGYQSMAATTSGANNIGIGSGSLSSQTTASSNTAIVTATQSGNFDASVIIGRAATATAANQFVVGSASYPAGAVATEVLVSDRSWAVIINGTAYKILLKA